MKRLLISIVMIVVVVMAGCVLIPIKANYPLPKTSEVFIGETLMFKDIEVGLRGIKNIGRPVNDDPYYQEVRREYIGAFKDELEKNGFKVVEQVSPQSLVVKTKIGDYPPLLGGWLGMLGMGYVGIQIEIWFDNKLVLEFEEGANTTLGYQAKKQAKRLTPRIADKLRRETEKRD